jgi:hypothetical protein
MSIETNTLFFSIQQELIQRIDDYCQKSDHKILERVLKLWNYENGRDQKNMEEVGKIFSMSKQRIQQNKHKFLTGLEVSLAHKRFDYETIFLDELLKNPKPICFSTDILKHNYHINFYHAALSEIWTNVPFENYLLHSFNQLSFIRSRKRSDFEKYLIAKIDDLKPAYKEMTIKSFWDHFNEKKLNLSEKLLAMKFILSSNRLFFKQLDGNYYLLQTGKLFEEITIEILNESNSPLSRKQIIDIAKKDLERDYNYDEKVILNRLLGIKEVVRLDVDLFGLKKHLNYNELEWQEILTESIQILKTIGRQVYISEIYNKIKDRFPKLKSYYELASILKFSDEIQDVGEYNFAIKRRGIKRIKLKDLIKDIITDPNKRYNINDIYNEILKTRYVHRQGLRTTLLKQNFLEEENNYFSLKQLNESCE